MRIVLAFLFTSFIISETIYIPADYPTIQEGIDIAIDAFNKLQNINISPKVVSMPCQELFDKQSQEYKEKVIEKNSIKISVEAGSIFGWEKYVGPEGISLGMKSFGKSAPYKKIYEHFNLTSDDVVKVAKKMLGK